MSLAERLRLPTFQASGMTLFEHAFYPIFPPNEHAQQVLAWLHSHPSRCP